MGLSLSIAYVVCCVLFLILFSKIIGKLFNAFKTHAFALTYTSLFIKIIVVSTFTVQIKGQLEHKIILLNYHKNKLNTKTLVLKI